MPWPAIAKVQQWAGKRKSLLAGLVGVAVEEAVDLVPGARLAVRIVGEVAKHGVKRLAKPEEEVPHLKALGEVFPTEQLDQINGWLATLTTSYAALLDQLEGLTIQDGASDEELTALVKQALLDRQELRTEFDERGRDVRRMTLSLSRIEEKLDAYYHGQQKVALSLEDIKSLFVEFPPLGEWVEFRKARPDAIQAIRRADEHFLGGRRDEGAAELIGLLRQRGVGQATLCRLVGLRYVTQGDLNRARAALEEIDGVSRPPALMHALTGLSTAATRGGKLPVWRSLPRGFIIARKYRVEAEVGRGGMASVYRCTGATQVRAGEVVAIKVPAPWLMADAEATRLFMQEIEVSHRLSAARHPAIVQTLGYEVFDEPHTGRELYGLVLEYIEGLSLAQFLAQRQGKNRPLTPKEVVHVLKPVCKALVYAHSQGVCHRDVKPHNVMMAKGGQAKLMDFGIARVLENFQTKLTGEADVGTLAYMPPDRDFDIRSDVYQLGNLLLELLTFDPRGDMESRTDCPPAWTDLVADAMNRIKGKRPGSAREFLDRLTSPTVVRPTTQPSNPCPTPPIPSPDPVPSMPSTEPTQASGPDKGWRIPPEPEPRKHQEMHGQSVGMAESLPLTAPQPTGPLAPPHALLTPAMRRAEQVKSEDEQVERTDSPESDPLRVGVHTLDGVGELCLEQLHRLGILTVGDLLFHFPRAYEDLTDYRAITALTEGTLQTVRGEVVEMEGRRLPDGRSVVSVVISDDGKHCVEGLWFNRPGASGLFRYGQRVAFSGKPKWYRDHWQMTNPRVQPLDGDRADSPQIVPVYPRTKNLHAKRLRSLMRQAVERFAGHLPEVLPPGLRERHQLCPAARAITLVHFPERLDEARAGRRRFVYEEFLLLQLALGLRRSALRDRQRAPSLPATAQIDARIRRSFAFRLTADQDKAIAEICRDMAGDRSMQRLLQAEVGAGQTSVAIYALLVAVANKHQAILMAPTEVLARQHWQTLEGYLAQSRVRRLVLTGGLTPKERREALAAIKAGDVDLVVGTQALVQEAVQFARLGLVVIDEQHKFGVNQRARVKRLGIDPHYLVMTATPIPRTMALTVFGDLDVSTIRQLPPGRKPVRTRWILPGQREWLYEQLRKGLHQGQQGYVVCPLVEESETLDLKAATQTYEALQAGPFHEFRVSPLHGRMAEEEKATIMTRFRNKEIDLLVCTSIVEGGVDVPNATLMLVEHAERFGLSQLHQMRGRISSGTVPGQCWLFADPETDEARARLQAFVRLSNGFALAEEDARLRDAGQFFGTRQHGLGELRLGDVLADEDLLQLARKDAMALVKDDAGLCRPEHAALRHAVLDRYGKTLDLSEG